MSQHARAGLLLIALAYIEFVSLGLPAAVIGVARPTVRDTFRLPRGPSERCSWRPASGTS